MGPREFYALSMRQFDELRKRLMEQQERRDALLEYMQAQAISMIAFTGYRGWKDWQEPERWMPSMWKQEAAERAAETPERTADRVREQMLALMRANIVH